MRKNKLASGHLKNVETLLADRPVVYEVCPAHTSSRTFQAPVYGIPSKVCTEVKQPTFVDIRFIYSL
eukprot:g55307.t1